MATNRIAPPGLHDRVRRFAWMCVWFLAYRVSPTPMHGWRRYILRVWGAKIGSGSHPYPTAWVWAPWNLIMADGSCLGPDVDCYNVALVTLCENAIVSQKAYLCTASHDIRDPLFPLVGAPIVIGERAWVAAGAFIGPDVTVGDGAVVAACAVVTRSVDPMTVVGGNPSVKIGDRIVESVLP